MLCFCFHMIHFGFTAAHLVGVAEVQQIVVLDVGVLDDRLVVEAQAHVGDLLRVELVALVRVPAASRQQLVVDLVPAQGSGQFDPARHTAGPGHVLDKR